MRTDSTVIIYTVHELVDYINWVYFFHAWGFQPRFASIAEIHECDACRTGWLAGFPSADVPKATEAIRLYQEAQRMLRLLDESSQVKAIYRLMDANSDGDDLLLDGKRFPLLRQQTRRQDEASYLCLSDYVRPLSQGMTDTVGAFAASAGETLERQLASDPYKHLIVQTLDERLAEAAVDKLHETIRKEVWGYAKGECLTRRQLLNEEYQGIRPAVGYPSLPDLSVTFLLDELMDMKRIGIRLTENGMMQPHASICGLMFAHPQARYFSVGKIDEQQLADYAGRRGIDIGILRKFLITNL